MNRQYNPLRHVASWANIPLIGVADGEFYNVEYREDQVTLVSGGQGDTVFVLNTDQTALFTVRLHPGSPANDMLSAQLPNADANRLPQGVFMLKDLDGTTVVHAEIAVISKPPAISVAKELPVREWQILLAKASFFAGGSI